MGRRADFNFEENEPIKAIFKISPPTANYEALLNKPKINHVELVGDLSLEDLGIIQPEDPGDGRIIIYQGDEEKGTFTVNQQNDTVITLDKSGSGVITFMQGDEEKGSFAVDQSENTTITLEKGGSGRITLMQGDEVKGSFVLNQDNNTVIELDKGDDIFNIDGGNAGSIYSISLPVINGGEALPD